MPFAKRQSHQRTPQDQPKYGLLFEVPYSGRSEKKKCIDFTPSISRGAKGDPLIGMWCAASAEKRYDQRMPVSLCD